MSCFEIVVTRLSDGHHTYAFEAPAQEIGLSDVFRGQVSVQARLERRGRQFLLDADVLSPAHVVCDRCLKVLSQEVAGSYRVLYVTDGASASEDVNEDDVRSIAIDAQLIDLDDDVRQTLELAVPPKVLCREECLGLCPRCGKDLNTGPCGCDDTSIDPRWEPLRRLKRKEGKER